MAVRGKDADVGAEFDEDGTRGGPVDAGDGHQELDPVLELIEPIAEHGVEVREPLGGVVESLQLVVQDKAAGLVELGAQGVTKVVHPRTHVVRERGEDLFALGACDESFEDAGAVGAEQVREDAADAHPGSVEDLVDAVSHSGALAHELTTHARDFTQGAKACRGDEAGLAQAELTDAREPQAVGDVGLAPLELLDVLGVHEEDLDARVFERLVGRFPVNPGALHHRGADLVAAQPLHERVQTAGQGAELPGEDLRLSAGAGHAHRGRDLHLVHVQTARARMDDVHRVGAYHRTSSCGGWGSRRKRGPSDSRHTSLARCGAFCCASTGTPGTMRGAKPLVGTVLNRAARHRKKDVHLRGAGAWIQAAAGMRGDQVAGSMPCFFSIAIQRGALRLTIIAS